MSPPPIAVHCLGPARLTAGLDRHDRLDVRAHLAVHGSLPALSFAELVALAEEIGLRGRGGAGFPFARKLVAVQRSRRYRGGGTVVVVNATEGEPGSRKDKMLLTRAPHLVIDGAVLAAEALGAHQIAIGVAQGEPGAESLLTALRERTMRLPARVVEVPSRFISGESGALVRGINGDVPIPPGRKRLASDSGVNGLPTLLSNAETYAQLAVAARSGPHHYASVGTPSEPGTVLLTVDGAVLLPGVVETPTGVRLADVLDFCGASIGPGVLAGGFHGTWISPGAARRATVSHHGMATVGGVLGAGIVLPLGEGTCPLGEVTRVVRYLAGESAGQCGPCRRGLPDLAHRLGILVSGGGGAAAIDAIRAGAAGVRGRGACAHPDGTARFVLSALETFADDLAAHLLGRGCGQPVRGVLPVPAPPDGGRKLVVDWTRCDGHGLCAHVLPELVALDDNGFPDIADQPVPAPLAIRARKAVEMCPALALRLAEQVPESAR